MTTDPRTILRELSRPFPAQEIQWKPARVQGNRCLALAFIDARSVMDRLDRVLGLGGWQTSYRELKDGVVCRLHVRIGDTFVEHEDVGSFSDQPDDGDKLKAAYSDALKRVAVHVGVGRYLYSLPATWADYDAQRKQISKPPELPPWALPWSQDPSDVAAFTCWLADLGDWLRERGYHSGALLLDVHRGLVQHNPKLPANPLQWPDNLIPQAVAHARAVAAAAKKAATEEGDSRDASRRQTVAAG